MTIYGFSNYKLINNDIYDKNGKKKSIIILGNGRKRYNLKDDNGKWRGVSISRINKLTGRILKLPKDAKKIPGYNEYFIDKKGNIYSFSDASPEGKILKHNIGTSGYPRVSVGGKQRDVHTLLAKTFIMEDYIERGLCCMHKDNNKLNFILTNICIGTYSQNNKQAYDDNINQGNKNGGNKNNT